VLTDGQSDLWFLETSREKSVKATITPPMTLQLVASPPVPARRGFAPKFQLRLIEHFSDTDMLNQRESAIPWLIGQSTSMVRKTLGLFSSSGDQQEQPFVQVNVDGSIWIRW
jgi:hypothetical protein